MYNTVANLSDNPDGGKEKKKKRNVAPRICIQSWIIPVEEASAHIRRHTWQLKASPTSRRNGIMMIRRKE